MIFRFWESLYVADDLCSAPTPRFNHPNGCVATDMQALSSGAIAFFCSPRFGSTYIDLRSAHEEPCDQLLLKSAILDRAVDGCY